MQKKVLFRLLRQDEVAQIRFICLRRKGWYEQNIQPIEKVILEQIPAAERKHDASTRAWQIPLRYWSALEITLSSMDFSLIEQPEILQSSYIDFTRDLAILPIFAGLFLLFILTANVIAHFSASHHTIPIRPMFSLSLGLICFLAFRFKSYKYFALTICLLALFNPIWPVYIVSWWFWQCLSWLTAAFVFISGCLSSVLASHEQKSEYWWLSLS